jgi:predicted transcriptional regulator
MREILIGHITSNPNKIKVLEILKRKEGADEKVVSKFTRIPVAMLKKTIDELKNDGVIEERDGGLYLTDLGAEVLTSLKGI